jgi:hypothetical protein
VTLGQDWPTEELRDVLQEYGFRILGRERLRSGSAPWRRVSGPTQRAYDAEATWTETHYTIRRDMVCEACDRPFGYVFEVTQVSHVHEAGRGTDGSLRRELGRQLRRRVRCSHCRACQKEPRRTLLRQDRRQVLQGCGVAVGGLLGTGALALLGGWLAGLAGFLMGLVVAMAVVIGLWFAIFPRIFARGSPV